MDRFEAFKDMQGNWRWRLMTGRDRVVSSSAGAYDSKAEALRAAGVVKEVAAGAGVSEVPGIGPDEMIARLISREEARRLEVAVEGNRRAAKKRQARSRRGAGEGGARLSVVGGRRPA